MGLIPILAVAAVVIILGGLLYTYLIGRKQRLLDGELDSAVSERVQERPYMRNPIFLVYIVGFLIFLGIVAVMAIVYR